jgi:hypothetical protein
LRKLAKETFSLITIKEWASGCKNMKEEEKYTENEHVMHNTVENFSHNLGHLI